MFNSLQTRLILASVLLVLLTAGALMWFGHKDTVAALRQAERRGLNNILFLLESELAAAHAEGLQAKVRAVEEVKAALVRAPGEAPETLPEAVRERLKVLAPAPDGEGEFFFVPAPEARLYWLRRAGDTAMASSRPLSGIEEAAGQRKDEAAQRFKSLLREVRVQETGFAAVLDAQGRVVAGPPHAVVPEKLRQTLGAFTGAARRLMVLPDEGGGEVLYLLGYFPPLAWHIVLAAPVDELEAPAVALIGSQLGLTALVAGLGVFLGLVLASRIARPVRRLSALARDLPERDITTLDAEALARDLPVRRADEVGELSRSFAYMAGELRRKVEELLAATAVRERLENELQVARDIQYGILPKPLAGQVGVDLHAAMWTAKEVGGDLYDFFMLDDRRLCFAIGDVSDKGVPASLFMSMTVTLLRVVMPEPGMSPEKAMARINDILARDNPRNMFVTLCIGILDLESGELAWASGGHMSPVRVSPNRARNLTDSEDMDMVVGVFEGVDYRLLHHRLAPGESLFLYTDGVSEAMNAEEEQFGEERLLEELAGLGDKSPREMAEAVRAAVAAHAAGAPQSDDIAVMALTAGRQ